MKVRCLFNKGEDLRIYEYKPLEKDMMGRFGATGFSEYNELDIGKEYLVMGVIVFQSYQAYLIDDNEFISACPCQLFEVIDSKISSSWYFRLIEKDESVYPFIQAVWGYYEFCFDRKAYENLIVEKDEEAMKLYFKRKRELGNELE